MHAVFVGQRIVAAGAGHLGGNGIAVMMGALRGDPHRDGIAHRQVQRRFELRKAEHAGIDLDEARGLAKLGLHRDQIDRAPGRVLAIDRALRPAHDLEMVDIEEIGVQRHRVGDVDAIDVVRDRRLRAVVLRHVEADPANRQIAFVAFRGRHHEPGHKAVQIDRIGHRVLLQQVRRQRGDRQRRALHVGFALLRGDHDIGDRRRGGIRCRRGIGGMRGRGGQHDGKNQRGCAKGTGQPVIGVHRIPPCGGPVPLARGASPIGRVRRCARPLAAQRRISQRPFLQLRDKPSGATERDNDHRSDPVA